MTLLSSAIARRAPRPVQPRCRGGASSLLRVAPARPSGTGEEIGRTVERLARAGAAPAAAREADSLPVSIITLLQPSRALARA